MLTKQVEVTGMVCFCVPQTTNEGGASAWSTTGGRFTISGSNFGLDPRVYLVRLHTRALPLLPAF